MAEKKRKKKVEKPAELEAMTNMGLVVPLGEGKSVTIKRLSAYDFFKFRSFCDMAIRSGSWLFASESYDLETIINECGLTALIAAGIGSNTDATIEFLAYLVDMTPEDFKDPGKVPFHAPYTIAGALRHHTDIRDFLAVAGEAKESMAEIAEDLASAIYQK